MAEQTIFIIRHGEKPVPASPFPGLKADGTPDPSSLLIRGWQRAGAWAALFGSGLSPDFPKPDAVYASDPTRSPDADPPSKRPWETITPLADRLGLQPILRWAQGQEQSLAKDVLMRDGVTLICWEHRLIIASILPALPIDPAAQLPARWKGHRFDVVFRLRRHGSDDRFGFDQLTPCLLDGDKDHPMA